MKRRLFLVFCLAACLTGCGGQEKERICKNPDFGFSLVCPVSYQVKEIKWVKELTGFSLQQPAGTVTVQAMGAGTDYEKMPFDQYVRIAAAAEIQNFDKLTSLESFTSEYGIKGYKTYWEVVRHEDTDSGEVNSAATAGPIYYFPSPGQQKLGAQPVKAIMISGDPAVEQDVSEVAASFRYLNSFRSFFGKPQHNKLYFVRKGKKFRVELAGNPTTGYNWYIDKLDENYFQVRESGYQPPDTRLVGAGGKCYWEIMPLKPGFSTIKLLYYRSWEGKAKAVDRFEVRVVVL
jgi:inhibitor of cysteine peptidase